MTKQGIINANNVDIVIQDTVYLLYVPNAVQEKLKRQESNMPAPSIKAFAKKYGKSEAEIEKLWDKAKKVAKEQYPDRKEGTEEFYKVVMGILKKMMGVKEATFSGDFAKVLPPLMNTGKRILPFTDFLAMTKKKKKKKKPIQELSFRDFVYQKVKEDLKNMFNVDVIEAEVMGKRGYRLEFDDKHNVKEVKQKISDYFKSKGLKLGNFVAV